MARGSSDLHYQLLEHDALIAELRSASPLPLPLDSELSRCAFVRWLSEDTGMQPCPLSRLPCRENESLLLEQVRFAATSRGTVHGTPGATRSP